MSSVPNPVTEATTPFVPNTTPAIERANRLISLRTHPGFLDVLRISQELVQSAADQCADYPGWDPQQIVVLKVRMQCAKEHHALLIARINEAIYQGIEEGKAQAANLPSQTPEEAVDRGDFVRQRMLQQFNEMDNRPAGSY